MKKNILILIGICLLALVSIYIFIPNNLIIRKIILIETSERIISENLDINNNRIKWWPVKMESTFNKPVNDSTFLEYKKFVFKFKNKGYNFTEITVSKGSLNLNSYISRKTKNNAIELAWQTNITTSYNPVTRVSDYLEAKIIKQNMTDILEHFAKYISNAKHVYGIPIKISIVKDTLLITTKIVAKDYPTISEVYTLVKVLRKFAQEKDIKETNSPMLNINKSYQGEYETMVAIPINKFIQIEPGSNISIKRMVPGNILTTEVKGGKSTIANGYIQLDNYMKDFKFSSPAKPFEMLITDRSIETDTSKWVTKLYYPIF